MKVLKYFLGIMAATPAFAGGIGGISGMPWEGALSRIANSLTGPTAAYVGLIGIIIAVVTMLWHQDLGAFGKTMAFLGFAISVLLASNQFITAVFGVAGALI